MMELGKTLFVALVMGCAATLYLALQYLFNALWWHGLWAMLP